jgi:hypothetical protein
MWHLMAIRILELYIVMDSHYLCSSLPTLYYQHVLRMAVGVYLMAHHLETHLNTRILCPERHYSA